jgi:hypothetical protein
MPRGPVATRSPVLAEPLLQEADSLSQIFGRKRCLTCQRMCWGCDRGGRKRSLSPHRLFSSPLPPLLVRLILTVAGGVVASRHCFRHGSGHRQQSSSLVALAAPATAVPYGQLPLHDAENTTDLRTGLAQDTKENRASVVHEVYARVCSFEAEDLRWVPEAGPSC